jgi:hypothetical protein
MIQPAPSRSHKWRNLTHSPALTIANNTSKNAENTIYLFLYPPTPNFAYTNLSAHPQDHPIPHLFPNRNNPHTANPSKNNDLALALLPLRKPPGRRPRHGQQQLLQSMGMPPSTVSELRSSVLRLLDPCRCYVVDIYHVT